MREPQSAEAMPAVIDGEGAIQLRVDVDAGASIAAPARAGAQLEETPVELHGVIVLDGALVLEAADAVEVGRRGPPGQSGMRGSLGEARIVAREKPIEDTLGLHQRASVGQAKLDHEAILERAEESLNATFTLRRPGRDPANAKFLERPSDLGGLGPALELRGQRQRGAGIAVKDPMPIGVGGGGEAIAPDQLAEEEKVAVGIFLKPKDTSEHLAGRIVDRGMEDEAGAAVLQPGVLAAVHLDEEAGLGHAFAAAAMPRGATSAGTADPGRTEEALHSPTRHPEALALGQQFGKVVVIHRCVDRAG